MITKELLRKSMAEAPNMCSEEECEISDAMNALGEELRRDLILVTASAIANGNSPSMVILSVGVHVGYLLHKLETTEPDPPKMLVN